MGILRIVLTGSQLYIGLPRYLCALPCAVQRGNNFRAQRV